MAVAVAMVGCSVDKKVPYTVNAEMIPYEKLSELNTMTDPVLAPGDILNIEVTATDMAAVAPFNKGMYVGENGTIQQIYANRNNNGGGGNGSITSTDNYLVNSEGEIDFPGIGIMKVSGLTKPQLAEKITNFIYPKYVKERPKVDVRLANFRVFFTGAVRSPGVVTSANERLNFLEALAMAGDLDIKGDRENILLYRTNPDGSREVHRLNINDRNFLMSPYFNLQQNDIIYVVPNKSLQKQAWQMNPYVTAVFTYVGGISSILSLTVGIMNLVKK